MVRKVGTKWDIPMFDQTATSDPVWPQNCIYESQIYANLFLSVAFIYSILVYSYPDFKSH